MRWYIEYASWWVCVFFVYFFVFTSSDSSLVFRFLLSLVFSTIISAVGYSGYVHGLRFIKMKSMSEDEKVKLVEKERKRGRLWFWVIVVMLVVWIVLFAFAFLLF